MVMSSCFSFNLSISSNPRSSAISGDILGSSTCSSRPVAYTRLRVQSHLTVGFSSLANILCRYCHLFGYIRVSIHRTSQVAGESYPGIYVALLKKGCFVLFSLLGTGKGTDGRIFQ